MKVEVILEYIDNDGWHFWDSITIEGDAVLAMRLSTTAFELLCWKFLASPERRIYDAVRSRINQLC